MEAVLDSTPAVTSRPALPRLRSVLVATDFSAHCARAVDRAALLAREHAVDLALMHVVAPTRELFAPPVDTPIRTSQARVMLARTARRVRRAHGVDISTRLHAGPVRTQILQRAARKDLLVIGHGNRNPITDWLVGSRAERLLDRLQRPMLVVKRDAERQYRRVLVPVDLAGLGAAALRTTTQLLPDAAIDLMHVLGHGHSAWLRRADIEPDVVAAYRSREALRVEDELHRMVSRVGDPRRQIRASLSHGEILRAVRERQRETDADLLVVVRDEPSPWRDFLLGSLTRRLIAGVDCDVLVLPRAALAED